MAALSVGCVVAAVAWAYLVLGHGRFWQTGERLPRAAAAPVRWPGVAAVIPARNEAGMLPVTLPTLLAQDYPGALTVILVDDCSSDGTAEVANQLAREAGGDGRDLRVVAGAPPPPGWAGKVWAMAQGVQVADGIGFPPGADGTGFPPGADGTGFPPEADGTGLLPEADGTGLLPEADGTGAPPEADGTGAPPEYVLFTDADIAWDPGALRGLVAAAQGDDRDLVSQMALLRTATSWERVIVPAFVYFFAQLYPFRRVNRAASRTAAAAGGCMLVRRDALGRAGGLAPIAGARIDDVALGRLIKRGRGRTWLGLSTAVVSVRPYPRLGSLWHMVARSAYIQLNYSPWLLAGTIAGLLFLYALPPAGAIAGLAAGAATTPAALAAGAGLAGWALMSLSFLPLLRLYRLSPLRAPGLPLIALLYAAMTVDSARRHYAGRGAEWKGRTDKLRCCRGR